MITHEKKQAIIKAHGRTATDTGSPEVQVGIMTARIEELTEHTKINKKDHAARRGLLQLVGQRKRLLTHLAEEDPKSYLALIKKLGLRR